MSSKDKKATKSTDKSKEKKLKSTKIEKKETIVPPSPLEQMELQNIGQVVSREGIKESKIIAHQVEQDDYYQQTFNIQDNNKLYQYSNQYDIPTQYTYPYYQFNEYDENYYYKQSNPHNQQYQKNDINPTYQQQQQWYQNTQQSFYNQNQLTQNISFGQDKINNEFYSPLNQKKQEILYQLSKLDERIEIIRQQGLKIEKQQREVFEGMIFRLNEVINQKTQILFNEQNNLMKDLNEINQLQNQMQYDQNVITYQIQRITQTNFIQQINIDINDLPNELIDMQLALEKNKKINQLMEFKNEVIWQLCNEKEIENNNKQLEDFKNQTYQEITEWSHLVDQYVIKLKQLTQQCCFCEIELSHTSVNSICNLNTNKDAKIIIQNEEQPPQDYFGNSRHYFVIKQNQETESQIQQNQL